MQTTNKNDKIVADFHRKNNVFVCWRFLFLKFSRAKFYYIIEVLPVDLSAAETFKK